MRRPVLFAVIVIVGSILILFDVPLLILLPLIILTGVAILFIVGALTIPEIRSALKKEKPAIAQPVVPKPAKPAKIGIIQRLNEMKFFEKKPSDTIKKQPPRPASKSATPKAEKKEEKTGVISHIRSFVSSMGSLGSVIRQRSKQGKKVDDINKLLDKTVSEKVHAPASAGPSKKGEPGLPSPSPGGAGGAAAQPASGEEDPFMSLSGDEFDLGLLDGLDDDSMITPGVPGIDEPAPGSGDLQDPSAGPPDLPPPSLDLSSAAGDILKNSGDGSLDEFAGLDSGDTGDADFGDLDSLSLDGLEGDLDEGVQADAGTQAPAVPASGNPPASAKPAENPAVKTAWISSDAPKDAGEQGDQISTQADMASFASGASGDEDLLSSIASDVKHVKKEKDVSLLRELKDFKAPAGEIEQELTGMFERLNSAQQSVKKTLPNDRESK